MASFVSSIRPVVFLYAASCLAQHLDDDDDDDNDTPVPGVFPRAFVVAMAVAIVGVVLLLALVCALAHSWQHILGRRGRVTSLGAARALARPGFRVAVPASAPAAPAIKEQLQQRQSLLLLQAVEEEEEEQE
ncbi:uncharacterized protein F4812DRAFT_455709 [Daldinia caldariorum]|uniref:uncharacterized protein n=1 Tax=Daldinia caldariorum TaxID=326644 RepID=UPI002007CBCD|nr:uncharacterized protein F4812DRAFT_455709 [Daldinia caldariorum]KAI1471602.1 hypothetical protein F4812DRAFT_455709 [Daldinia caldariorum]